MVTPLFLFLLLLGAVVTLAHPRLHEELRRRRSPVGYSTGAGSYSGSYSGGAGSGVYGGYHGFGPGGYWGQRWGNPPPFPVHNLAPLPYQAPLPFDLNALFNQYFSALQQYHNSLQSQFVPYNPSLSPAGAAGLSARQISLQPLQPLGPVTLRPPTGQWAQLASNAQQSLRRALCQALQRLQVTWAQTASVCSGVQSVGAAHTTVPLHAQESPQTAAAAAAAGAGHEQQGGGVHQQVIHQQVGGGGGGGGSAVSSGIVAVSGPDGGTQVSVISPPGAVVEHFQGPGGLQGVSVSHQSFGPSGGGGGGGGGLGNYIGSFSSVSSSSSNLNGHTQSHHSATTGVNNNGHVSSITVTKP